MNFVKATGILAPRALVTSKSSGLKRNFNAVMNASRNLAHGIVGAGIVNHAEFKVADKLIKKEIAEGAVKTTDDAIGVVKKAIAGGQIKKLPYKKEFITNPTSDDALKFIQKEISTGGLKAAKIYKGNTEDIYIIGRKMGSADLGTLGVTTYADELVKAGFDRKKIHIFDEWSGIKLDSARKEIIDVKIQNGGRQLSAEQLADTEMSLLNTKWMDEAIGSEGVRPTIIELERNAADGLSYFFDKIELSKLNESGRLPWN